VSTNSKDYNARYSARGAFASADMATNGNGVVKVEALKSKTQAAAEVIRRAEDALIAAMQRQRALDQINGSADDALRQKYPSSALADGVASTTDEPSPTSPVGLGVVVCASWRPVRRASL
jgi:hypothetical protein